MTPCWLAAIFLEVYALRKSVLANDYALGVAGSDRHPCTRQRATIVRTPPRRNTAPRRSRRGRRGVKKRSSHGCRALALALGLTCCGLPPLASAPCRIGYSTKSQSQNVGRRQAPAGHSTTRGDVRGGTHDTCTHVHVVSELRLDSTCFRVWSFVDRGYTSHPCRSRSQQAYLTTDSPQRS